MPCRPARSLLLKLEALLERRGGGRLRILARRGRTGEHADDRCRQGRAVRSDEVGRFIPREVVGDNDRAIVRAGQHEVGAQALEGRGQKELRVGNEDKDESDEALALAGLRSSWMVCSIFCSSRIVTRLH